MLKSRLSEYSRAVLNCNEELINIFGVNIDNTTEVAKELVSCQASFTLGNTNLSTLHCILLFYYSLLLI